MNRILDSFRLKNEKEDFQTVINSIYKGVEFRGTNLWILVFAIFIASLGLNVNSTAVIIGAMLVSPIMGPIMGLGLGMAINDIELLKKSLFNYFFAACVGLTTSTIYFLLSPINDAHSEILARTSPNIYDVLIALFGGLAGILATSSKQKGNVIPGVAIATALMPPLCTAGYGLATSKYSFFFGAFYLFIINTVFIALATFVTARVLKFPFKHLLERKDEAKAHRIVWSVVIITLLPSMYFGYDIVQQNNFQQAANRFIEKEAVLPNDYLLRKNIDTKNKLITLTYGGQFIEEEKVQILRSKLMSYNLDSSSLEIRQGFAYLQDNKNDEQAQELSNALNQKDKQILLLKSKVDSMTVQSNLGKQIFNELKVQYPLIQSFVLNYATNNTNSSQFPIWLSTVQSSSKLTVKDKKRIEQWLKIRTNIENLDVYFKE